MRRGEIWRYAPPASPRRRVVAIVSSDGVNDSRRPWVIAADIHYEDPRDILAVAVGGGWVSAADVSRLYRPWFAEQVGTLDDTAQERLDTALRAGLDL